jgi:hypothetical protein
MEPNEQKLAAAKELYLYSDKTQSEIATEIGINRKTLYNWMRFGQWDKLKSDARQIPASLSQDCHTHIYNINKRAFQREDQCPTPAEVSMISRLVTASSKLSFNKGHYIEMMMDFLSYIGAKDKVLQKTIAEASAPFMDRINYPEKYRAERLRQRLTDLNAYIPDPYPEYNEEAPTDPEPHQTPDSIAVFDAPDLSNHSQNLGHNPSFNQLHHSSEESLSAAEASAKEAITYNPDDWKIIPNGMHEKLMDAFRRGDMKTYDRLEKEMADIPIGQIRGVRRDRTPKPIILPPLMIPDGDGEWAPTQKEYDYYHPLIERPCIHMEHYIAFRDQKWHTMTLHYNLKQYKLFGREGRFMSQRQFHEYMKTISIEQHLIHWFGDLKYNPWEYLPREPENHGELVWPRY